jgi:phage anti-repressor protein
MKKKSDGMSPDMLNDAMSSTPIPVFTTVNEGTKNETQNLLQNVPDGNSIQNELIKVDFDKQTVSARALYNFFGLAERFYAWCARMFSYGLEENVDFTTAGFHAVVNNGAAKEIGDYLLTIDAAKHIAMVQRNEKGRQARNYFINIEKLYWHNIASNNSKSENIISLLDNLNSFVGQMDKLKSAVENFEVKIVQQNDNKILAEKNVVLDILLDIFIPNR